MGRVVLRIHVGETVTTPARTWKVPVSFLGSNLVLEALSMSGHEQFPPREHGVRRVALDPASWAFAGPRGDTCTLSLSHMEAMSWSCYNACKDMEGPCLIPGIQPGAGGLVHVRT